MPDDWSDRRYALPQGCVLRDYTIQEVLGHGGFGIVYMARHNELDHVVAIKEYLPSELAVRDGTTIRAQGAESEPHFADGLRRFREEAKALIEFHQHPSIVGCREFFRANGTAYLVMEYVDGLPLSELLRKREAAGQPFTESDLLGIAIPLAQGLAHIHRAGVIHRDITPANILVRKEDQRPVLIDFGAAKQAVAEHSRSLAPYTEGYAALEQVADGQLGPWTDLYGYGAVLWRMVAGGKRPWEPPNPVMAESRANACVREADDPLPTAKELGAGRFAEQLLDVIDGCLQLRDTDRIREGDRVVRLLQVGGENPQPAVVKKTSEASNVQDNRHHPSIPTEKDYEARLEPEGEADLATPTGNSFRNNKRLASILKYCFLFEMFLAIAWLMLNALEITIYEAFSAGDQVHESLLHAYDSWISLLFPINLIVTSITTVFFLVWTYRVNQNAHSMGSSDLEFTPKWAVLWYFIPFANLWKPYKALKETFMASFPDNSVPSDLVQRPIVLPIWWTFEILAKVAANPSAQIRALMSTPTASEMLDLTYREILSNTIVFPWAITCILIVDKLDRWQNERMNRMY